MHNSVGHQVSVLSHNAPYSADSQETCQTIQPHIIIKAYSNLVINPHNG